MTAKPLVGCTGNCGQIKKRRREEILLSLLVKYGKLA